MIKKRMIRGDKKRMIMKDKKTYDKEMCNMEK